MPRDRISGRTYAPSATAPQAALQLDQSIRQLLFGIGELVTVTRATLPQFYGIPELRARWGCSADQVVKHLRDHVGYVGAPGVKPSVSLEDVLRIDAVLKAIYEARKRVLAVRSKATGQEVAHAV
ncbi:MAG TPA: hypothetical protein VHX44_09885 [Planctomycetota bacterium]|jgi:hypothetical protein|nr:hypothetical protein [Planctomycetota bacterium]